MSIDLNGSRILVTGAFGFFGRHLMDALRRKYYKDGTSVIAWPRGANMLDPYHLVQAFTQIRPDYVFHLAGYNGGIEFNSTFPADIFMRNTVMGCYLMDICAKSKVKKAVSVVASCAYGDNQVFITKNGREEGLLDPLFFFDGEPHQSVACHGFAKRNLQLACRFYHQQYSLNAVCACPTTLYGPGDSLDPKRSKVMGGLITTFLSAVRDKRDELFLMGSGNPLREFLYVEDAAKLLIKTMEEYEDNYYPLNLGTGHEVSIKDLANLVAKLTGFDGKISWDTSKPDGQLRKRLVIEGMTKVLGDFDTTPLEKGIKRTIADYQQRKQ